MTETKNCFLHYGRHTIRACRLPDGRIFPDFRDVLRVLCILLGVSEEVLARMPQTDTQSDSAPAFKMLVDETSDRPETQAFKKWLDEKMFGNGKREWDINTALEMLRHFGTNLTQAEVVQTLLESPDCEVVNEGNTTYIHERSTGELLATIKREEV